MRLIDADTLERKMNDGIEAMTKAGIIVDAEYLWGLFCNSIDSTPTIDAEPIKHGYWMIDEDGNIECSECGHRGVGDNYCERCGAKMDEVSK